MLLHGFNFCCALTLGRVRCVKGGEKGEMRLGMWEVKGLDAVGFSLGELESEL